MTKFEANLNEVNVVLCDNHPIRFIPTEKLIDGSGRSGDWHGWSYRIYRTKTGKLILGVCNWSSVQGETDYLHITVATGEKELYEKLNMDNYIHRLVGIELQKRGEMTETI
ncbi:MAG: hypothetical protein WC551_12890 [Patescibacteria group bacterium]